MQNQDTLAKELRAALDQVRGGRAATLALVDPVGEDEARRKPSGGGWSAAEVLDHLLKTDGIYQLQFSRAFELQDAGRPPVIEIGLDELNTRPSLLPAAAMSWLDMPLRLLNRIVPGFVREYLTGVVIIPFQAPDAARPGPDLHVADLRDRLRASALETERMVSERDVRGVIVDHTLLGRNTVAGMLRVLARHEDRHRAQIARVLAEAPGAAPTVAVAAAGENAAPANGAAPDDAGGLDLEALSADADTALAAGRQVVAWWRDKTLLEELELFPLGNAYPPYREVHAFFDSILLIGQMEPTPIMGCLQRHRFKRRRPPAADAGQHLESFVDELFLARCAQPRPDGSPGGFRYRPLGVREPGGKLAAPPADGSGLNLAALRSGRELVVLRVDILDFLRVTPLTERLEEMFPALGGQAADVVVHPDLAQEPEKAPPGVIAQSAFGYAFLPRAPVATLAGFGPGRFDAAVKQWRFFLYANGDVEVRVSFLVAPRSRKVLDLAGFDPVYSSIEFGDLLSLRMLRLSQRGHDALDTVFLDHHWRVHARVVDGLKDVWEGQRWTPAFGTW